MRRDCILPGVKLIEYIESTGTQYIDTGVRLNGNSRVVCDYMAYSRASSQPRDRTQVLLLLPWQTNSLL